MMNAVFLGRKRLEHFAFPYTFRKFALRCAIEKAVSWKENGLGDPLFWNTLRGNVLANHV
jgi:hypothetical protein